MVEEADAAHGAEALTIRGLSRKNIETKKEEKAEAKKDLPYYFKVLKENKEFRLDLEAIILKS